MKKLVIVESPSKSKTIEKYLGSDYKVVSSKGHIRDLAKTGKGRLGVDVENGFKPSYIISTDKKDVVSSLKNDVSECDFVYLATDPDREGEAISWHLAQVLDLDLNQENRIVFNEITKNAVLKAIDNPRTVDMALVRSQETRRILDRIIGFRLSTLLKSKIHSRSAGRVQSVALRMICDREAEIKAFVPEEYWTINALLKKGRYSFDTQLIKVNGKKASIQNEQQADDILSRLKEEYVVSQVSEKKKKRSPYLPFITSTLQQEASSKLNFSAKRTMATAQSLYEGVSLGGESQGLITYMRTDSTRLSQDFITAAGSFIENEYGKEYKGHYRVRNDENAQDAHEAIRPTSLQNVPDKIKDYLTSDQYRLYKMIYARALASLMSDAVFLSKTYLFDNNDCIFSISGSEMTFDGFLKAYKDYDSSKDVILHPLEEGDVLKKDNIRKEQHFTEGPSRYTEARLIKALEEEGVGRPSTYASIIDTIQDRGYAELKKENEKGKTKYFFPTERGILTDEKLKEHFNSLINVSYTAQMEKGLDDIADNKVDNIDYLQEFYDGFEPLLNKAYADMEKVEPEKTGDACPLCGSDLVYREGRFGKFIACASFPKCKYKKAIAVEKEKPEDIGRACPECGSPLLKRKSRYGTYFIGCSAFPKCKYTEKIVGEESPKRYYRRKKK